MSAPAKKRLDDTSVLLSILDHLPTSIFVKDENLRFVYSNQLHCDIIGKAEEELLGYADSDFYPEDEARVFTMHDRKVLDTGCVAVDEEIATRADGKSIPVLTRKVKLTGPDNKTYLIGTNSDMTDVRKRENQYKALTETIPVGVVQLEEDGVIAFSNPLFNAYCGGDSSEEGIKAFIDQLGKTQTGFPGVSSKFETEIFVAGLGRRSVIAISSGWLRIGGNSRSAIISVVDVSEMMELRRVNEEVSRLNRELADNMKRLAAAQDELVMKGRMEQLGQLTATIAHELRNPLGSVRTSAFLIERKIKDKNLGIDVQLQRINKGVLRCDNIITQLLDYSRTRQLECQSSDLDTWLAQVVEEEAKKLPNALLIMCDLNLADRLVPFDPSRLQRALLNLLSNASEAMLGSGDGWSGKKSVNAEIRISTQCTDHHFEVSVADNGPGMSSEVMARVREPLFTTKSFGTGLGIPAIEQIVAQHGGELFISSEVGKGSRFVMRLPLDQASRNQAVG